MSDASHWDAAYAQGDTTRSWYQPQAAASLRLLDQSGVRLQDAVVDVGGGASVLVDDLVRRGHRDLTVVDLSDEALRIARTRLGAAASGVTWVTADVRTWRPTRTYAVWHDRAVFHFLTSAADRAAYCRALRAATSVGSLVLVATFALSGPEQCSGLPVARYDAAGLLAELGSGLELVADLTATHVTPWGTGQDFTWVAARRVA